MRLVVAGVYDLPTDTWSVNAVNAYTYTPFGSFYDGQCIETIANANPFKFTGQWHDVEIDQYFLRARMYDPAMMRFTARDPVRGEQNEPLSLHKYLYCGNEPLNRIDPTGQKYSIMETIEAGYENHYGSTMVVAYGAATLNWDLINLGIALDRVTQEVMILTAFKNKPKSYDGSFGRNQQASDNAQGNFNPGPKLKGTLFIALAYLYIEGNQDFLWTKTAIQLIDEAVDWAWEK